MYQIFDLDGTVIDSSHRKNTLPDGTLDLAHWIANNTPEKIAADSLLPCAETMRAAWDRKHSVMVCTARVLSAADYAYFAEHGLRFHYMLSRPAGAQLNDADLKEIQLRLFAQSAGMSWAQFTRQALMYDDSPLIIERMTVIKIQCINAADWNAALARRAA